MKKRNALHKTVVAFVSAIATVMLTLPMVTSAVGLVSNARSSSAISGAAAPKASKNAASSAGAGSGRASAHSSTERSAGSGNRDAGSDNHIDLSNATWVENKKRNLEWTLVGENNSTLVLRQKDKNSTVDANALIYSDDDGIFNKTGSFVNVHESSIKKIVIDGKFKVHNAEHMFRSFDHTELIQGLENIEFVKKDNEPVKVDGMFTGIGNYPSEISRNSLKELDGIEHWDMKNVQDAQSLFDRCGKLESLDLSGWQNVNFTDIQGMFQYCDSLKTVKLFNASNATLKNINHLFEYDKNLKSVTGFENWDTRNVTNMGAMFNGDESLNAIDSFAKWNTGKVTSMNGMFASAKSLETIKGLENWDTKSVRDISCMFMNDEALTSIGSLAKWNTSNVIDMDAIFQGASRLKTIEGLENWNTSNVKYMQFMFYGDEALTSIGSLAKWDTSKVVNMFEMFLNTKNLKTIAGVEKWNTSNVNNMFAMFYGSGVESLNLEKWSFNQGKVKIGDSYYKATAGMFQDSGLRDLTLPAGSGSAGNSIPDGIWHNSRGTSGVKPGENMDLDNSNHGYIRWVRDYIKVTFKNSTDNTSLTCVADVLQGKNAKHNLSDTKFTNCKYEYSPSNDTSLNAADKLENAREMLSAYAENSGLTYTAKLIRNSKKSSVDTLKNLLKEADSSRSKPVMNLDGIKKSLGIVDGDTVTWDVKERKLSDYIKEVTDNNVRTGVYYLVTKKSKGAKEVIANNYSGASDLKISGHELVAWKYVTFTADVKHKPKPKPKPPVPTPPQPQPQPQPGPQPGPSPTPTPQPVPQPTPTPTPEPDKTPQPTPQPTPTPNPDDHGILPDITIKPDLNIHPNQNPNPFQNQNQNPSYKFEYPFQNVPQNAPQNPLQSIQDADAKNNALRRALSATRANRANGADVANSGAQKQLNGNDGTCKCVCPTSPSDANSRNSAGSAKKSENNAASYQNGNKYSWLETGGLVAGLIISWLIMLLIGFVLGYKMRKKRDEKQIVEE